AAVGTAEARSLQESLRKICRRSRATFWQASVHDVHLDIKMVEVRTDQGDRFLVPYDKLVIAVGAQNATFGVPGVKEHAHFLKTTADARKIRYELLALFEQASLPLTTEKQKKDLLSFVVAGGGPTGVEFAADLYDFIHEDVSQYFPNLLPFVRVSIIQSGEHILNGFAQAISEYAETRFRRQHINVITNARVMEVRNQSMVIKNKHPLPGDPDVIDLPFGLTGIEKRDLTRRVTARCEHSNAKALEVDGGLQLMYHNARDIYALGDCATIANPRILNVVEEQFKKSGRMKLTLAEFNELASGITKKYPQTQVHLSKVSELFAEYDTDGNNVLDLLELKRLLSDVDKKMTSLPATAQVASQQGSYLARKFNVLESSARDASPDAWAVADRAYPPFRYRHLGSFSYVGGNEAVYNYDDSVGGGGLLVGLAWRGAYLSRQVSLRTRALLAFDWAKRYVFGRDISR
ncbi:hypothetical protein HK405_012748, partial [Cladochytrium tenue]